MNDMLKHIKACFALSSAALAYGLNLSVHTLNAVISGRRQFRLEHWLKVQQLYEALSVKRPDINLSAAEAAQLQVGLNRELQKMQTRLESRETELEQIRGRREHWLQGYTACESLLNLKSEQIDEKWLRLRKKDLTLKLKEYSLARLMLLETEIAGLRHKIDFLRKIKLPSF